MQHPLLPITSYSADLAQMLLPIFSGEEIRLLSRLGAALRIISIVSGNACYTRLRRKDWTYKMEQTGSTAEKRSCVDPE